MNILVIFTGGTISSSLTDGYISPNEKNNFRLIEEYKKKANTACNEINFSTVMPYYILSENLNGNHINMLADCIDEALAKEGLDGIIVTHGTDTLQYTAAGLSYIYTRTNIPVVLVSSNYILDDERANGLYNFSAAVDFISNCTLSSKQQSTFYSGVYVAYKNTGEDAVIHYGARLMPHAPYSDSLYSLGNNCPKDSDNASRNNALQRGVFPFTEKPRFTTDSNILYIHSYPGQQYQTAPDYVKAILLDTYHSGTLCTENAQLKNFLLNAAARNIPVFLTGMEERDSYESTRIYDSLSINALPKASPIAMYMKLWLLISSDCSDLIRLMEAPICYDLSVDLACT